MAFKIESNQVAMYLMKLGLYFRVLNYKRLFTPSTCWHMLLSSM